MALRETENMLKNQTGFGGESRVAGRRRGGGEVRCVGGGVGSD